MGKVLDLRSSVTEMLLLSLLTGEELYGQELREELRQCSDGFFALSGGTFYPLLHRLERKGWIAPRRTVSGAGRHLFCYRLTAQGRQALLEQISLWRQYTHAVEQILSAAETCSDATKREGRPQT